MRGVFFLIGSLIMLLEMRLRCESGTLRFLDGGGEVILKSQRERERGVCVSNPESKIMQK